MKMLGDKSYELCRCEQCRPRSKGARRMRSKLAKAMERRFTRKEIEDQRRGD